MPPELDELKDNIHELGKEVAGLKPMVKEVHGYMPRIVSAMEKLAEVSVRMENNTEEHKRIHYRITDVDTNVKSLQTEFDSLKEEHIVCVTTKRVERQSERSNIWAKFKTKATEKAIEWALVIIIGATTWMVATHTREYIASLPKTPTVAAPKPGGK